MTKWRKNRGARSSDFVIASSFDILLFVGKRRGETLSSREDRLHRKARAARRARSDCSRPEDEGKNKPVLARLHDSFSPGVAHGAISRAAEFARCRRNFGTGKAGRD